MQGNIPRLEVSHTCLQFVVCVCVCVCVCVLWCGGGGVCVCWRGEEAEYKQEKWTINMLELP